MVDSIHRSAPTLKHLAITLAGLAVACGGDDAEPQAVPKVDTIAGVVVVRNETGLWRESEQWRIVEEFRVGSLWGGNLDEELGDSRNTSVTMGPNGQIFVAEYTNDRVMVFSGDGEFVRSIGRAGEGPGEFRHPTAMAWDGNDRLWVAEGIRRPYQVFDSSGAYQKSVPRPIRSLPNLQHPLVWESTGTFVEETGDDEQVVYLRVDTLGQPVDTAAVLPLPDLLRSFRNRIVLRSWESARFVTRHYLPRMRFSRAPDGTIWSTTNDRLRLVQTGPRGDTIRIAETVHRPAEFDRKDLAVIAEGLAELGIPRGEAELVRPVVDEVRVMDDGHILVGIVEEVGKDPSTFDVFDPDGFFLGTVDLGFKLPRRNVPALVGDTIIAVSPGAFDVPYLVRVTIERPG